MSESDNPSSPKNEEMEVSENGDTDNIKETSKEESKTDSPAKKKKQEKEEEEEEEDDDDDDEEPPLGLLERPVVLTSGKREKKKVERLSMSINLPGTDRKKVDIPEGKGTKLGDCPRVEFKLNHTKANDLKPLHRILFNKAGAVTSVKKNIRQFSGFTFAKGDKEFDKRMTALNKMMLPGLKLMCEVLDIERSGTKAAIIERLMDFLLKPTSSGLKVPQAKKRKSKGSGDSDKKGAKRKRASKKKEKKSAANKDTLSDLSDSDADEDDDDEDKKDEKPAKSDSEEEEEEEEEEEPPKKKAKVEKKTPVKKEPAKKQNGKQEKAAKTEKKESKKKISDSEDSDSDDEPLIAKKEEPPSNSELKDVIKKILDGANLEEVTMKTVVKQVYEKYPSFDLTDRKDFIKTTVREIIS